MQVYVHAQCMYIVHVHIRYRKVTSTVVSKQVDVNGGCGCGLNWVAHFKTGQVANWVITDICTALSTY